MPRNYDRLIRYYDSWLDDLQDPDKGFSAQEQLSILLAIRDAQRYGTMQPIDALPIEIRRGLQLATLKEQVGRIIERCERARSRGRDAAAARYAQEQREQAAQERKAAQEYAATHKVTREEYLELQKRAANGDQEAIRLLKGGDS